MKNIFTIENLKIKIDPKKKVKPEEGDITLLVQYKETGHDELIKVFGSVFSYTKQNGSEVQNVKFTDSENQREFVRWYAGGEKHMALRDAAANGRKQPIQITIKEFKPKLDKQGKETGWKVASIIDYNLSAEFV